MANELSNTGMTSLKIYLISHEYEIADSIEDFGDLAFLFQEIFGRVPIKSQAVVEGSKP